MISSKNINLLLLGCTLYLFAGCDESRVYETNTPIKEYSWDSKEVIPFTFEIQDTSIYYNVYINARHTARYSYSNLWLKVTITFPGGKKVNRRFELSLADKNGKWYGNCMGDLCDLQIPFQFNAYFNKRGKYTFEIVQNMRQNPLHEIMEIGLRIERSDNAEELIREK